jgi:hypothetical protein
MISHKYRVVFVHVPKCAGNTIVHHYFKEIEDLDQLAPEGTHSFQNAGPVLGLLNQGYNSASQRSGYLKKCLWLKKIWDEYYKFTIVRNPYDRFISGLKHAEKQVPGVFFDSNDRIKESALQRLKEIDKYHLIINKIGIKFFYFTRFYRYPHWYRHTNVPQTDLISENKKLLVDKVLHFENLQSDFNELTKELNMKEKELPFTNTATHRKQYQDYLCERPELVEWINQKHSEDFELLNFSRSL